jgi:hypothetical protein
MTQQTETAAPFMGLARVLSDLFAPAVSVFLICVATGVLGADGLGPGLLWGAVAGLFCAITPMTVIQLAVRRERLTDRHVTRREQRWWVFLMCLASVVIGIVVIAVFHGPRLLLWALATMIVGLIVTGVITALGVKVSMHAFCLTSLIVMLAVLHSPWWLLATLVLLPLLFFARRRLRHHTLFELILGTTLATALVLVSVPILAHP